MSKRSSVFIALLFIYCLSLYPAVLNATNKKGYDAPIYYEAGRGNTEYITTHPKTGKQAQGWIYSDRTIPPFKLLAKLPYPWFLAVIHLANSIGLCCLLAAVINRTRDFPIIGWLTAFVLGSHASDVLSGGQITGLLCGMSLHPVGALLACAVKPHYALALVLHASVWAYRKRTRDKECCLS